MIRVDEETGLGVAHRRPTATAVTRKLDPYTGAQLALAEAYRNVAATGAKPLAVTDCLNFGSPEDPGVMWQFARGRPRSRGRLPASWARRSPAATCRSTTRPATSRSARRRWSACSASSTTWPGVRRSAIGTQTGQLLYLLGDTREEFGGSAWSQVVHDHLGGLPPEGGPGARAAARRDPDRGSRDGMLDAAHDLSDGGLIAGGGRVLPARRERCAAGACRTGVDPFVFLFSESAGARGRLGPAQRGAPLHTTCAARAVCPRPGSVSSTATRSTCRGFSLFRSRELRRVHSAPLPALFEAEVVDPTAQI